jgi:hypothetical protein
MKLINTFEYGDKKAEVHEIKEGFYLVEYYVRGALVNKTSHHNIGEANLIADEYTDTFHGGNKQFLNENA